MNDAKDGPEGKRKQNLKLTIRFGTCVGFAALEIDALPARWVGNPPRN
jgi:hypothetical protein